MQLKIENIAPIVDYTGRLEPSKKAELKFEISGRLSKKLVQPGEFIKSGDKITANFGDLGSISINTK